MQLERFKAVEIKPADYDVKNRFYVYQLCALNKQQRPKYRLVKQFSSAEKANEYIANKEAEV